MTLINFSNRGHTTLQNSGGLAAGSPGDVVTLQIPSADATGVLPGSGNYDLVVDTEYFTVTAGQGTTALTATRGKYNTAAAAHVQGAAITEVLTAFDLQQFLQSSSPESGDFAGTFGSPSVVRPAVFPSGSSLPSLPNAAYPVNGPFTRTSDNTLWQNLGGTWAQVGGLGHFSWTTKTANYTITPADAGVLADATGGNVTITLPTAVGGIQSYAIARKDASANTVTIATTSAQTIDGFGSVPLVVQDQAVLIGSEGSNWFLLASYYPSPLTTKADIAVANAAAVPSRLGVGIDGYALVADSTQPLGVKWAALAGSSTLAGDSDTNIASPENLDLLQFRTSDSKWHNEAAAFPAGKIGYAQITANITTTSTTAADAAGLTVTVTVGTRPIKITVWAQSVDNSIAGDRVIVNIFDTTGSAVVATGVYRYGTATGLVPLGVMAPNLSPAAGSRSYKVQWYVPDGGTGTIDASATSPAFILIEEI